MNNRYNFLTKILNFTGVKNWIDLGSGDGSFQKLYPKNIKMLNVMVLNCLRTLLGQRKIKNLNNVEFYNFGYSKL